MAGLKKGETVAVSANVRERDHGKATEKAATAVNVSPRLVETAVKVSREAPRERANQPRAASRFTTPAAVSPAMPSR
jgi:hypothetical protein